MTQVIDCIVAGGGVIGLAVARRMAMAGQSVAVIEAEGSIGQHTSSRNSEVVHAGIYYGRGSLKARLCVAGKEALYRYCERRNVPHNRIGKLIVATAEDQEAALASLLEAAVANDVNDLEWLPGRELARIEPAVVAAAALYSPSTGIVDSHAYMLSLQGDLEDAGGIVVTQSRIDRVVADNDGFLVRIDDDDTRCRRFVNAAGLWATGLARKIECAVSLPVPATFFARGHYFSYAGRSPFHHLVYPLPDPGGLGVHVTMDLAGRARFGPDVKWIDGIDYSFQGPDRAEFAGIIRRYFPAVAADRLSPSYTGIRPKLSGPGEPPADFRIDGPAAHGQPGLVNLFGIESPGLTASLAIADYVFELLQ